MSDRPTEAKAVRMIAGGTDVLADVLATAGLRSRVFCRMTLRAPWRLAIGQRDLAHFHVIERGRACLQVRGRKVLALGAGDLVVLMRGQGHSLADTIRASVPATAAAASQGRVLQHSRSRRRRRGDPDALRLVFLSQPCRPIADRAPPGGRPPQGRGLSGDRRHAARAVGRSLRAALGFADGHCATDRCALRADGP